MGIQPFYWFELISQSQFIFLLISQSQFRAVKDVVMFVFGQAVIDRRKKRPTPPHS